MLKLFTDVWHDITADLKYTETIVVAKPVCSPARHIITKMFQQYGVKIIRYREHKESATLNSGEKVPALFVAKVTVSSKQAVWAEYLLLRSKQFFLRSQPLNKRNREWAEKHDAMPESWNGKPLIEKSCKDIKCKNDTKHSNSNY